MCEGAGREGQAAARALPLPSRRRPGNNAKEFEDFYLKNGSNQGQDQALTLSVGTSSYIPTVLPTVGSVDPGAFKKILSLLVCEGAGRKGQAAARALPLPPGRRPGLPPKPHRKE